GVHREGTRALQDADLRSAPHGAVPGQDHRSGDRQGGGDFGRRLRTQPAVPVIDPPSRYSVTRHTAQTLLIDADDTLWENNVYFERVIEAAQEMLESYGVDRAVFRACLDDLEPWTIAVDGYGTLNFTRSLVAAFERFLPPGADPELSGKVESLALGILEHPIELLV